MATWLAGNRGNEKKIIKHKKNNSKKTNKSKNKQTNKHKIKQTNKQIERKNNKNEAVLKYINLNHL